MLELLGDVSFFWTMMMEVGTW